MTAPRTSPNGFVFIVTYGRSGSTLLQKILNSIPGYCIRGENGNSLFHLYRAWRETTEAHGVRNMRRMKRPSGIDDPWHGAELINPDSLARSLVEAFTNEVLHPPHPTRIAGFKEIRWHKAADQFPGFMRFVHTYFPNAKVIINTRNLDDVARSGWWTNMKPASVKAMLGAAEAMYAAYRREFPLASIAVHYNDYVGNPDAFAPLYAFLGETFDREHIKAILDTPLHHLKSKPAAPRIVDLNGE